VSKKGLRKPGGTFGAPAGAVSEVGHGWYEVAGDAADRDTLGELLVHAEAANCDDFDGRYAIVNWDPFAVQDAIISDGTRFAGADLPTIKGKTNLIPASPATEGTAAAAKTAAEAVNARLPASPAAVSDIPTAEALADAVLDEALADHETPGTVGEALGRLDEPVSAEKVLTAGEREAIAEALLDLADSIEPAHRLRPARVAKILKARRIRRHAPDGILRVLRGPAVHVAPGTVEAATSHLRLLRERLHLVQDQLAGCHARLDVICKRLGTVDESGMGGRENEPRVVEILRSLPGAGRIVAATLLAEASRPLLAGDYQAMRTLAGIAPVTRRSGKSRIVVMRKACNPRLRNALYHWARVAAMCDPAWRTKYHALRARGLSHGRACRGVADSLIRVCVAMVRNGTLYDPARPRLVRAA